MEEPRKEIPISPEIPRVPTEVNVDKSKIFERDTQDYAFTDTNFQLPPEEALGYKVGQEVAKASIASVDQEIKPASSNTIVHSAATHKETIANGEFRLNPNSPGMSPAEYLESMINGSDKKE
jgi:hypothetical protein